MIRPGVFNMSKFNILDALRFGGVLSETEFEDEENQIKGFVHIFDFSHLKLKHSALVTPLEAHRITTSVMVCEKK